MTVTMEHILQHQRGYEIADWVPERCAAWIRVQMEFDFGHRLFPKSGAQDPLYHTVTEFANLSPSDRKY